MPEKLESVDDYIAMQPEAVRSTLHSVRAAIRSVVPDADESIAYKMPTYKLEKDLVIHFAGWKHHYSLHPTSDNLVAEFKEDLAHYEVDNGTIRFPFSQPVPTELITHITSFRAKEINKRNDLSNDSPKPD